MGTALARIGDVNRYAEALMGVSGLVGVDSDGKPILKLDRREGYWKFGEGDTELEEGDIIAVNPLSFKKGFVAFANNDLAYTLDGDKAEILVPITAPLPYKDDLPDLEEVKTGRGKDAKSRPPSWQLQLVVEMVVVEGPNVGTELKYSPVSKGGLRMVRKLSEEVARRMLDGMPDYVPIIELFTDFYDHKEFGKTFTPEFEIIEWSDMERETFESAPAEDEPEPEPAPKGRRSGVTPEKHPKPGERTGRGHKVIDAEPEHEEPEAPEERPARGTRGRSEPTADAPLRGARRGRDRDEPAEAESTRAPRSGQRPARGREEEVATTRPARTRSGRTAEPVEEVEEAPRTRRDPPRGRDTQRDVEDTRGTAVRGRRAASGRRG